MQDSETRNPDGATAGLPPEAAPRKENIVQLLFEVFCACIFLGMIGLVFYNTFLRYVFSSSFPPSEEWARFLFIYITFFGAIEAFIHKKHIAVDLLVSALKGASKKSMNILASLFSIAALGLLLYGGVINVLQTMDTYSVATGVNMAFINGTLPIMALAAMVVELRSLLGILRRPTSSFQKG
ncbi:MAG: TRAP transporter small permease [Desulfovibrio desulfuricans]|jgi:TRAP-type C4-dicarboxylate transport system permease small subunit|nr:TRAP transporter small permease [Desulfovibrio desulfuricans]